MKNDEGAEDRVKGALVWNLSLLTSCVVEVGVGFIPKWSRYVPLQARLPRILGRLAKRASKTTVEQAYSRI